MIWEVDDDCDKCVNWAEFQAMYHRCRNDKTGGFDGDSNTSKCKSETNNFSFLITFNCSAGYEPRRLFNVVEFLMNDKDDNGSVSVEEAMQILYLRHGRSLLDTVRNILPSIEPCAA